MPPTQCNPQYVVPGSIVDAITTFLRSRAFRTVHYVGYADEGLIRSLINESRYTLTLMDYWDRYHRGAHFFNDDASDLAQLVVPDWLEGIPTYFEGAPRHEVLLQDIPWLEGQLEQLTSRGNTDTDTYQVAASMDSRAPRLALHRQHRGPKCVILFGEAPLDADHPHYDWQDFQPLRIGLRKDRPRQERLPVQGSLFDD